MFENLIDRLDRSFKILKGEGKITEINVAETLKDIRKALVDADVSYKVAKKFCDDVKQIALGQDVLKSVKPSQMMVKIVHDELARLMGGEAADINLKGNPAIVLVAGLQGSGKTTFSGKLALNCKSKRGMKVMLVACDVYRPAAILQLKTLCRENNLDFFSLDDEKDVRKIVDGAIAYAKENQNNVLILDTAGRLQIDTSMMAELLLLERMYPLNEKLLVIDSMTGQEAIDVARNFDEQLGITGIILTKLDGDTKGGCALSVVYSTKKAIKLVGMGEKIEPLEDFYPDRMASRILGMGDIVSLVEKAQQNIDVEEAKKLEEKFLKAQFSFDDFLKIQKQIKMLGSFDGILGMLPIPGLNKDDRQKISHEGEKQFKKMEVFISSMTPEERRNPDLLNASRKKRIARGAGMELSELNAFVSQFEQMRKMMQGLGGLKQAFKKGGKSALMGKMPKNRHFR